MRAEDWIRQHVTPVGDIEVTHRRPWATVMRVPVAGAVVWFKACAPVQAFEARLTSDLFARWPDLVTEVLAVDEERRWLLLADAGTRAHELGNPPELWLEALPRYAELQIGETPRAPEHLERGVPDLRTATLAMGYRRLLSHDLPLEPDEISRLEGLAPRFAALCAELDALGIKESVQHDDLRMSNLYVGGGGRLRFVDWGDSSVAHPFFSLVVTFRFLESFNHLSPSDPWFQRLRDAYLEPWGRGLEDVFHGAIRVGWFAHAIAWTRQRDALPPEARPDFDADFARILRSALAQISEV
jgi:hypothetical protein